uniref:Hexosyltransferase n=1 Tax=Clytia hemisphaerica TaxID=252671 RepID=A0A7M6DP24_9CNID
MLEDENEDGNFVKIFKLAVDEDCNMRRITFPVLIKCSVGLSLLFVLGQFSLLLFCSCKCNHMEKRTDYTVKRIGRSESAGTNMECKEQIGRLNEKIVELEKLVKKYQQLDQFIITDEMTENKKSLNELTFLKSYSPRSEHEVIPFSAFDSRHVFGEIGFLSKRPRASPIGQQASELREVLNFALQDLNRDVESNNDRVTIDGFVEGITRNDFLHGTVYDLFFRSANSNNIFKRLKVLRPFQGIRKIGKPETIDTSNEIINIIIPLSGRIDKFIAFMDRLVGVGIRQDRRIFITVVYFGMEGREEVKKYFLKMSKEETFEDYKVIFTKEEFNRGRGLQKGAKSWKKGNVLMFFCDIDIYFDSSFLERCRLHTSPGSKIYYPVVFSQYNPSIIYGGRDPPSLKEQMNILPESGFWRISDLV